MSSKYKKILVNIHMDSAMDETINKFVEFTIGYKVILEQLFLNMMICQTITFQTFIFQLGDKNE